MSSKEFTLNVQNNIGELTKAIVKLNGLLANQFTKTVDRNTKSTNNTFQSQNNWNNSLAKSQQKTLLLNTAIGNLHSGFRNFNNSIFSGIDLLNRYTVGLLGVGFSVSSMISQSVSLIKEQWQLGDTMTYLTDSTTSASQALGAYYKANAGSKGSLDQTGSALKSLADAGMSLSPVMLQLASTAGTLEQATGLSAESWGRMAGSLHKNSKASIKDIREFQSAILATDLKAGVLQQTMDSLMETLKKLKNTFRDGIKDQKAFQKGYLGSVSVMTKLGIEAQTANKFIDDLLDPEKFEENMKLFARLGLTAEDYFKALESGSGATAFIDTAMKSLPNLAREINSLPNPVAKLRFAKTLGLDMQIASKMVNATTGDIENMLTEYKKKAVEEKALQKREEQAKANAKKFDEAVDALRRKALMPLMGMISNIMTGSGMRILQKISSITGKLLGSLVDRFEPVVDKIIGHAQRFLNEIDSVAGGESFGTKLYNILLNKIREYAPKVAEMMLEGAKSMVGFIGEKLPSIISGLASATVDALGELFKKHPFFASILGVGIGVKAFGMATSALTSVVTGATGLIEGAKGIFKKNTTGALQGLKGALKGLGSSLLPIDLQNLNEAREHTALLERIADNTNRLVPKTGSFMGGVQTGVGGAENTTALGSSGGMLGKLAQISANMGKALAIGGAIAGVTQLAISGYDLYKTNEKNKTFDDYAMPSGGGFYDRTHNIKEAGSKMVLSTAGAVAGAVGGAKLGASLGAMIGTTVFPALGTAIGSGAGLIIGGAIGGLVGSGVGDMVANGLTSIFADGFNKLRDDQYILNKKEDNNFYKRISQKETLLDSIDSMEYETYKNLKESSKKSQKEGLIMNKGQFEAFQHMKKYREKYMTMEEISEKRYWEQKKILAIREGKKLNEIEERRLEELTKKFEDKNVKKSTDGADTWVEGTGLAITSGIDRLIKFVTFGQVSLSEKVKDKLLYAFDWFGSIIDKYFINPISIILNTFWYGITSLFSKLPPYLGGDWFKEANEKAAERVKNNMEAFNESPTAFADKNEFKRLSGRLFSLGNKGEELVRGGANKEEIQEILNKLKEYSDDSNSQVRDTANNQYKRIVTELEKLNKTQTEAGKGIGSIDKKTKNQNEAKNEEKAFTIRVATGDAMGSFASAMSVSGV